MSGLELRAAQRFIDNKGQPQEKPKPPPRIWSQPLGEFHPPDGEIDARLLCPSPPFGGTWPFATMAFRMIHPDNAETDHYCFQVDDGRWLELIDPDVHSCA
jgi:hypothetical protein